MDFHLVWVLIYLSRSRKLTRGGWITICKRNWFRDLWCWRENAFKFIRFLLGTIWWQTTAGLRINVLLYIYVDISVAHSTSHNKINIANKETYLSLKCSLSLGGRSCGWTWLLHWGCNRIAYIHNTYYRCYLIAYKCCLSLQYMYGQINPQRIWNISGWIFILF
jgi:hypothetical protein